MQMLNKWDSAQRVSLWLTNIAEDKNKIIKSVSLVNDGEYILAVVLYEIRDNSLPMAG